MSKDNSDPYLWARLETHRQGRFEALSLPNEKGEDYPVIVVNIRSIPTRVATIANTSDSQLFSAQDREIEWVRRTVQKATRGNVIAAHKSECCRNMIQA